MKVFPSLGIFCAALLAGFLTVSCGSAASNNPTPSAQASITLQVVASGFSTPLGFEHPDDNSGRTFVVQQGGTIQIIQNGAVLPQPFLDISNEVMVENEMGLLGVAFHPNFTTAPKFYVNYTRSNAGQFQSVISEFTLPAANSNQANPVTERILLVVNQAGNFDNHKAGKLAFGPDGFLYFGLGDGGSGGDPFGHGQNTQTLLGKMMRIDVDSRSPGLQYGIPADNPFVNGGGLPEIYAIGFRNPWRFSFDHPSGRIFVGDVGQDSFEEIDILQKGANYGWNTMEGDHCFNPMTGCNMTGLTLPITEIPHPEGEAVIGGFVYHGTAIPALQGMYVFGDLNGTIWQLQETMPNVWMRSTLMKTSLNITSFGQDTSGELYVLDLSGNISKIVPAAAPTMM